MKYIDTEPDPPPRKCAECGFETDELAWRWCKLPNPDPYSRDRYIYDFDWRCRDRLACEARKNHAW
jgi:hypothetical protein